MIINLPWIEPIDTQNLPENFYGEASENKVNEILSVILDIIKIVVNYEEV